MNTEVLDGKIILIPDNTSCYIVAHHPNKSWGYNIGIIKEVPALFGWDEVERLGPYTGNDPELFYSLVPVDSYEDYKEANDTFIEKVQAAEEPESVKKPAKIEPTIIPFDTDPTDNNVTPNVPRPNRLPKLVSDREVPLYTYKQPNKR